MEVWVHLDRCQECVHWVAEAPATPEEEAVLSQLPAVSPKDLLARSTAE